MSRYSSFSDLYEIITRLRAPEGCPWDRKQTLDSMKSFLLEESYETVTAVQEEDTNGIEEELGDVLLIVSMMIRILEESGDSSPVRVFDGICRKLIRRHPHVFAEAEAGDAAAVKQQWDRIKETVEGRAKKKGVHAVPLGFPPLERSFKIQQRAAKNGFDWEDHHGPFDKLTEEIEELREAIDSGRDPEKEAEIGDILFSAVNLSRKLKIDPMSALHRTNQKFLSRYAAVEAGMSADGHSMEDGNLELMDQYWNLAKSQEGDDPPEA